MGVIEFIIVMISGLEYSKELVVTADMDVFESVWINEITIRTDKVLYPRFLGWGKKSQDEIVDTIASLNLYEFYDPLAEKSSGEDRSGQELLRKKIQAA